MANRKLELVFVDKDGKFYTLDKVSSVELADGLGKISKETAKKIVITERTKIGLVLLFFDFPHKRKNKIQM